MQKNKLDTAIKTAAIFHSGQKDKAGRPYILHPLHVMARMDTEDEMAVAVLHDLFEDTNLQINMFIDVFGKKIVDAIRLLTKDVNEKYLKHYIRRIAESGNEIAIKVKLADLEHNSDMSRLPTVTEKDQERLEKYKWAMIILKGERE